MKEKVMQNGYRVNAVVSGARFGILMGKPSINPEQASWAYFYLLDGNGLPPNEQIIRVCRDQFFPLRPSTDERTVLNLLKECAEYCERCKSHPTSIPEREVYHGKEPYTRMMPRFFDRTRGVPVSDLSVFIGSLGSLKANVLDRDQRQRTLVTKGEFLVVDPWGVLPDKELKYLQHVTRVLKIGQNVSSKWFRKTGPIAIDFEHGTVLRRTNALRQLRTVVLNNPFSILEGGAATGKSVLVLSHI